MEQGSRATIFDRRRSIVIVLQDAFGEIFGVAHVEAPGGLDLEDVTWNGTFDTWWAWVDLNNRPRPYQGRALAT